MKKRIAVVLFNLGGPDTPEAVRPFLSNLFNDPEIIGLPKPFRRLLARFISSRREKEAQAIYEKIGGKSPLLENTEAQAIALEKQLNRQKRTHLYKVFIAMRYWHPFAEETLEQVREFEPGEVILLPLYPQFSTTTSGSSLHNWKEVAARADFSIPTRSLCCYFTQPDFIKAHAKRIRKYYDLAKEKNKGKAPRILFSAHGLPEKIIARGDPYVFQVEETAKEVHQLLAKKKPLECVVCYQSKVGPLRWTKPSLEEELRRAAKDQKAVVVVPIAFVSEHSETLVELDIQYKELAEELGIPGYFRVPALGVDKGLTDALAKLCLQAAKENITSYQGKRLCGKDRTGCPCVATN